jgi:hypothetical protein
MGIFRSQSFEQPLPGIAPAPLQGPQADIQRIRGLFIGESQEVFNFNDLAPVAIDLLHSTEKHIDREGQVQTGAGRRNQDLTRQSCEVDLGTSASVIYQMPAHSSARDRKEVPSVFPVLIARRNQANIYLIHKLGCL